MNHNIFWLINRLLMMPVLSVWSRCENKFNIVTTAVIVSSFQTILFVTIPMLLSTPQNVIFILPSTILLILNWAVYMSNTTDGVKSDIDISNIYVKMLLKKILFKKYIIFKINRGSYTLVTLQKTKLVCVGKETKQPRLEKWCM